MSEVIACPNCDKKLSLRDELKGRTLICPQCNGRFTAPTDEFPLADDGLGTVSEETSSSGSSDMAFLDNLGPLPGTGVAKAATRPISGTRSYPAKGLASPAASYVPRTAAIRWRKKTDPTMIFVGAGIAVTVLLIIVIGAAISSNNGAVSPKDNGGKKKPEYVRWGLTDSSRHKLFKDLMTAVDLNGISKECKEEWFRLADDAKLDRKYIRDLLDEGFSRDDWDQPAPAHVTNQTRGTRMEWTAQRASGSDPVLGK